MSFADLGVSRPVADALKRRGIAAPFPIQKLVIDPLAGQLLAGAFAPGDAIVCDAGDGGALEFHKDATKEAAA